MSFREKMHWVSLAAIFGGFGWYFLSILTDGSGDQPDGDILFWRLVVVIVLIIATMTISAVLLAFTNLKDVNTRQDERDKTIHAKGALTAYYILVVGFWTVLAFLLKGSSVFFLANLVLGILVIGETVRIGAQLYFYRRGY